MIDNHLMILTAHDKNNIKISMRKQQMTILQAKENKRAWKWLESTVTVSGLC